MGAVLVLVLRAFSAMLLVRAVLSWFPIKADSGLYGISRFVHRATEPVLAPIRRLLPRTGRVDFSVMATLLVVAFVLTPLALAL